MRVLVPLMPSIKHIQYSCLENPMNGTKRQNDRILKEKLPRSVGAQYATGDQWRSNSRKNEGMEPKQKEYPAVDVTGDSLEKTLMLGGIGGKRRRGWQRLRCLGGITDSMDMSQSELREFVMDREGVAKSRT